MNIKNNYSESLRSVGLKSTPTRLAILECLANGHALYSIDEIMKKINKKASKRKYDWSTVYRCVLKLESKKILQASIVKGGVPKYELHDPNHHHHHIICNQCSRIQAIHSCSMKNLEKAVKAMGYTKISHRLEIFATCLNCQ